MSYNEAISFMKKWGIKFLQGFLFLVFFLFGAVFLRFLFRASNVQANSLVFYPEFCLGGWEKPQNASGQIDLGEGSPASAFNLENSAYLGSNVASQIFCGYFPIETKDKPPKEVVVSFSWIMKSSEDSGGANSFSNPGAVSVPTPITNEPTENTEINTENPVQNQNPEPVLPTTETNENTVPPQTTPEATPSSEVSNPIETNIQSFLNIFAKKALAQDTSFGQEFIDVSYSVDGIRWISIGKVSVDNFKNYSVNIPIDSWEDLKKIQIMLNVIPTVEEKPSVYLDGMSIAVDYDRPFTEAAQEGLQNTANAVLSALDTAGDKIVSITTVMEPVKQTEPEKPKEPTIIKEKKLIFETVGESMRTVTSLPWYSDDFRDKVKAKGFIPNYPNIEVGDNGKSLRVSGSCNQEYFVVLLWKKSDDYIERPGAFASNFADFCRAGKFSYDLNSISKDIQDGEYFLLVAEEDNVNPWVPVSALIPIKISSIIEESVIEQ